MKIFVATVLSFALFLGNSVKLRASVTGPVASDGEGPASQACACQTCCQGTAAIPGVPGQHGLPGSKGDAGQPGQNGDIGPIGPMGERGASGDAGPKGDDGIGQRGEIGPRGPPGVVGRPGQTGVKGQKGEPGETPDDSNQRIAFTAVLTISSDTSTSYDTRLPFQETETLLPGTSFDLGNGTFMCTVPGTYVFTFSVCKYHPSSGLFVNLRKNDDIVVSGRSNDSSHGEQVSGSVVLVLQRGDTVWLTMYGRAWSSSSHYTSFSGFLLYA